METFRNRINQLMHIYRICFASINYSKNWVIGNPLTVIKDSCLLFVADTSVLVIIWLLCWIALYKTWKLSTVKQTDITFSLNYYYSITSPLVNKHRGQMLVCSSLKYINVYLVFRHGSESTIRVVLGRGRRAVAAGGRRAGGTLLRGHSRRPSRSRTAHLSSQYRWWQVSSSHNIVNCL